MKLRNKKTGESINFDILPEEVKRAIEVGVTYFWYNYELYQPKGPLIKDEKIRKMVRALAETNDIAQLSYDAHWNAFRCADFVIAFSYDFDRHDGLKDGISYSIAELCGEEEE